MNIIKIENYHNLSYPLTREKYKNPRIIYHGTSSGFIGMIEEYGWQVNKQPYDIQDVKIISDIGESIGMRYNSASYNNVKFFSLEADNHYINNKHPSFSQNY